LVLVSHIDALFSDHNRAVILSSLTVWSPCRGNYYLNTFTLSFSQQSVGLPMGTKSSVWSTSLFLQSVQNHFWHLTVH